jgi:hypothetical protein
MLLLLLGGCMAGCTRNTLSSATDTEADSQVELSTGKETNTDIPDETSFTESDTTAAPTAPETQTEPQTEPQAETELEEDPALNVFPTEGPNIEIGIFYEPPAQFTTDEQYDWIRDANITFIEMTNSNAWGEEGIAALEVKLAQERGISMYYNPSANVSNFMSMSDDELTSYLTSLKENAAITGIHVVDEPSNPWAYARICRLIQQNGLAARLNLLPYFATWVFENYQGYVEDTIIATGKEYYSYLSYDQYPFPYDGSAPSTMYYNLNLFREIGLKYGVDTAFYIQSIGEHGNFRRTTGDEIRYHVSAGLAYGIKSYTYFTWWTTGYCDPADYAIISPYGEKTDTYDDVAEINASVLKVGRLLRRLDALEVYHIRGNETGVTNIQQDDAPVYPTDKSRWILSLMQDRETGRDYIMLVNKNYKKEVSSTFTVGSGITHLYNCTDGTYEEIDISGGTFDLTVQPGGFVLLAVGQHDNIVDIQEDLGNNLAEGKAVSVSEVNPGNGYYAYAITDGIRTTDTATAMGWRCSSEEGYAEVDLGRSVSINRVDIYPAGTAYAMGDAFPRDFAIQVSLDGETWTDVVVETDYQGAGESVPTFTFDEVEARYVRLTVTRGSGNGFAIAEIEIYHDDGTLPGPDSSHYLRAGGEEAGTNVALNRPVTASSYVASLDPTNLTDGTSSMWSSAIQKHYTENAEEYFTVDLVETYTIDRIVLTPRVNDEYFPVVFEVQVSEDGETFTTIMTVEHGETHTGTVPLELTVDGNVKARYIRIRATKLRDLSGYGDGYLFQLSEIEVYNK